MTSSRGLVSLAAVLLSTSACASSSRPKPVVAFVATGERAHEIRQAAIAADVGVELRSAELPRRAVRANAKDSWSVEQTLAAARSDYLSGELARVRACAERLGDADLVWSSLARRDRAIAARVLVWRIACSSIARKDDAFDAARTFAVLGLEPSGDIDSIPVEAHRILSAALHVAESSPKRPLSVKSSVGGATLNVDGRVACSTPCTVDVAIGDHHVTVEKNGRMSASRVVRVGADDPAVVSFDLAPASPELAGEQWLSTYGSTSSRTDDAAALVLLSSALRAKRLVYLDAETLADGTRVRGALVVDGRVDARDEQRGAYASSTRDVLRGLLVKGGVVESGNVLTRPIFWIAVGVGVAASAAVTTYLLYDPGTRTEVRTR